MIVISVIFKLKDRTIFGNIFSLSMKESSIPVVSVIIKHHERTLFSFILSLNMNRVSSIVAISVIIKLQQRAVFRNIFSVSIKVSSISEKNSHLRRLESCK